MSSLVICGLAGCLITAPKIVSLGIDFPFSNLVFALLTYPIVDCICELWGKLLARQTVWTGLFSQLILTIMIQLSIVAPHPEFWKLQPAYQAIHSTSFSIVFASLLAVSISQLLDIAVYQKIKDLSKGKHLWLRSLVSMCLGQIIDSCIFINIVFMHTANKLTLVCGSIIIKILLSVMMIPVIYLIIYLSKLYLLDQADQGGYAA